MKKCAYIKCQELHTRRSKYCKPACKTRQWEIDNGKEPFLKGKNDERVKAYHQKKTLSEIMMEGLRQDPNNGFFSYVVPAKYDTVLTLAEKKKYKNKLAVAAPIATALVKKDVTPKQLFWWTAAGYAIGSLLEWLQPKYIEQRVLLEPERTVNIDMPQPKVTKQRMTSAEYTDLEIPSLGLTGKYKTLFGDPSKDFYMVVDGKPGNGKSYWVAALAQHIHRNHGRAIYYAAEQSGQNLALQEMVKYVGTTFEIETKPHLLSKEKILEDMKNYSLVVMDSISEMGITPKDLRDMRKDSNAAIIGVLQSTKDGSHKGSQEWLHDVDISINVTRYQPQVRKTRYKKLDSGENGRVVNM